MLHIFAYHDKRYIYDTGSGSLHECDEKTARYLSGEPSQLSEEELARAPSRAGMQRRCACTSPTIATCAVNTVLRMRAPITPCAK